MIKLGAVALFLALFVVKPAADIFTAAQALPAIGIAHGGLHVCDNDAECMDLCPTDEPCPQPGIPEGGKP